MRLRTRLALAFALLALVPLALVVPFTIPRVSSFFSKELESHLKSSAQMTDLVLADLRRSARIAVEDILASVALEDFARQLRAQEASPERLTSAERLMHSRGLSVLSLFDEKGITLSSGHLPARVGDPDPALFAAARSSSPDAVVALVEVREEGGVRHVPALVAARPFEYGELRLWVVGGYRLDSQLADQLSRMTDARVEISTDEGLVAGSGAAQTPTIEASIPLSSAGRLTLKLSGAPVLEARALLIGAFVALALLGLALAALLGIVVARLVTRPIEAVTAAARKIASGAFDLKVTESSSGEAGELVAAFNRMTSELQNRTEQLLAAERVAAWEEVARRLAHEIKNPLTPIKMSLETLLAASEGGEPRFQELFGETAKAVLEEVQRLCRIVDEFSQFARLPKPQLQPLNLSELAGQILSLYGEARDGVQLRFEVAPDVWVLGDRDQLTQVLLNLLKNAEEAVAGGGWIELRIKRVGSQAVLEIADSGPGISEEHQARLFEPYFTTKQGGSGLGLAIAQRICQEHGGRLRLSSEPGTGAVFTLSLPAAAPAVAAATAARASS